MAGDHHVVYPLPEFLLSFKRDGSRGDRVHFLSVRGADYSKFVVGSFPGEDCVLSDNVLIIYRDLLIVDEHVVQFSTAHEFYMKRVAPIIGVIVVLAGFRLVFEVSGDDSTVFDRLLDEFPIFTPNGDIVDSLGAIFPLLEGGVVRH